MVCQEPPEAQKDKYEVLHPVQNNPSEIPEVGTDWQGKTPEGSGEPKGETQVSCIAPLAGRDGCTQLYYQV